MLFPPALQNPHRVFRKFFFAAGFEQIHVARRFTHHFGDLGVPFLVQLGHQPSRRNFNVLPHCRGFHHLCLRQAKSLRISRVGLEQFKSCLPLDELRAGHAVLFKQFLHHVRRHLPELCRFHLTLQMRLLGRIAFRAICCGNAPAAAKQAEGQGKRAFIHPFTGNFSEVVHELLNVIAKATPLLFSQSPYFCGRFRVFLKPFRCPFRKCAHGYGSDNITKSAHFSDGHELIHAKVFQRHLHSGIGQGSPHGTGLVHALMFRKVKVLITRNLSTHERG